MKKKDKKDEKKQVIEKVEEEEQYIGEHIFETLEKEANLKRIDEKKRSKANLIDYTIAILKPNLIASAKRCKTVIEEIQKKNFEVFDLKLKILTEEEVFNLYCKHVKEEYYHDIVSYNTRSLSAILILSNKEENYLDTNGIVTQYASPVIRWKELIGPKKPDEDKNKSTLRGKYGIDIIKNEFWGSDSASDAYRELSLFYFPIPAKAPEFKFNVFKVSMSTLMRFLFPVVPNHPDVTGRLDLFSKYGPVLDYHVLDICFCNNCKFILRKEILDNTDKDLKKESHKVLSDEFLSTRLSKLCEECNDHILHWSHMFSGRERTHILTNYEIDIEVREMNKEQLFTVLKAEKGSSAETILSKIDLSKPPNEIIYTIDHVKKLLSLADTDYYDRFDFESLQNLILEDRRIRINHWVGSIISKPGERFKIPQLINNLTKKDISDMKSHKFTLLRTKPIVIKNLEEEEFLNLIILHPMFVKKKLSDFEIKNMIVKLFNKNFFKVATLETKNNSSMASNMLLMRNYEFATLNHRGKSNVDTLNKLEHEISKMEKAKK